MPSYHLGRSSKPRPSLVATLCRLHVSASTLSRIPLRMCSACRRRSPAMLERTCKAYNQASFIKSVESGARAGNGSPAAPKMRLNFSPNRAEVFGGPEREINLKRIVEQEYTIKNVAAPHIIVSHRSMSAIQTSIQLSRTCSKSASGAIQSPTPRAADPRCAAPIKQSVDLCGRNQFCTNVFWFIWRECETHYP
jgi:hypothetical protein